MCCSIEMQTQVLFLVTVNQGSVNVMDSMCDSAEADILVRWLRGMSALGAVCCTEPHDLCTVQYMRVLQCREARQGRLQHTQHTAVCKEHIQHKAPNKSKERQSHAYTHRS